MNVTTLLHSLILWEPTRKESTAIQSMPATSVTTREPKPGFMLIRKGNTWAKSLNVGNAHLLECHCADLKNTKTIISIKNTLYDENLKLRCKSFLFVRIIQFSTFQKLCTDQISNNRKGWLIKVGTYYFLDSCFYDDKSIFGGGEEGEAGQMKEINKISIEYGMHHIYSSGNLCYLLFFTFVGWCMILPSPLTTFNNVLGVTASITRSRNLTKSLR